jgi:FMN phosphatase YigB (HAD superfamily)
MNTIIFDLDGTLLPMDFKQFMQLYFYELGKHFKDHIEPDVLAKYVMSATGKMVEDNSDLTNETVFMTHFKTYVKDHLTMYQSMFSDFYDAGFDKVKVSTNQNEAMLKSVKLLKEKGYELVIATNPLFPLKANLHRVRWAGLDINDFSYITSFEDNTKSKPNPAFFTEVLEKINKDANECLVVGNDAVEDLVAQVVGLKTYLVDDCILNEDLMKYKPDYRGSMASFYDFCLNLPNIQKEEV